MTNFNIRLWGDQAQEPDEVVADVIAIVHNSEHQLVFLKLKPRMENEKFLNMAFSLEFIKALAETAGLEISGEG